VIALVAVFFVACAMIARLFIWPEQGMPSRVDAIVMLDSPGHPLNFAVRLAEQHRAPFLVVSQGTPVSRDPCPRPVPGVTLICFNPTPPTTRGEAEFIGRLDPLDPDIRYARLPGHNHGCALESGQPGFAMRFDRYDTGWQNMRALLDAEDARMHW
jgi:hypothetical protein